MRTACGQYLPRPCPNFMGGTTDQARAAALVFLETGLHFHSQLLPLPHDFLPWFDGAYISMSFSSIFLPCVNAHSRKQIPDCGLRVNQERMCACPDGIWTPRVSPPNWDLCCGTWPLSAAHPGATETGGFPF